MERGLGLVLSRHELLDLVDQLIDAVEAGAPDRLMADLLIPRHLAVADGRLSISR